MVEWRRLFMTLREVTDTIEEEVDDNIRIEAAKHELQGATGWHVARCVQQHATSEDRIERRCFCVGLNGSADLRHKRRLSRRSRDGNRSGVKTAPSIWRQG
jgi:hypothetical protein